MTQHKLIAEVSHDSRRYGYATGTHIVLMKRVGRRDVVEWRQIIPPIPFHPSTPLIFLKMIVDDWVHATKTDLIPTDWLKGVISPLFKSKPKISVEEDMPAPGGMPTSLTHTAPALSFSI